MVGKLAHKFQLLLEKRRTLWLESKQIISDRQFRLQGRYATISVLTLIMVGIVFVSGGLITYYKVGEVCTGWPLCFQGMILPESIPQAINMGHRILVFLTGILLGYQWKQSWVTQRSSNIVLVTSTLMLTLFISQALLGAKLVNGFPLYLVFLHRLTAIGLGLSGIIHLLAIGFLKSEGEEVTSDNVKENRTLGVLKDMLLLTKPVVVALLLVTTYAGMVIGAKRFPSPELTFWTLLGGFLAAGGAGAINQVLDREDDVKMQRTQKRPIPAGRLTPAQGLAFGTGLFVLSFFMLVGKVNLLAALLSLAGFIYYVVIYSLWLKKTTSLNIVIGGGAGAIPPLVGWAAATGTLNIPALFLFAVVFMWTPPHFWALAIVRRHDYARAGVPMLPVVRGEKEARRQILIYTVQLVALTLLLPIFGLGGSVYLLGAILLGLWLLSAALRVWKMEGNKVAWKMYRYSSMYLALLFVVMMVDAII